ncbi:type II toxin-antitoxin system VapB family antitoxin [Pelagicoccus albus]|nr:type II toxin-antitoxin system VapB family antitoxin [Pelagicoccus albus]
MKDSFIALSTFYCSALLVGWIALFATINKDRDYTVFQRIELESSDILSTEQNENGLDFYWWEVVHNRATYEKIDALVSDGITLSLSQMGDSLRLEIKEEILPILPNPKDKLLLSYFPEVREIVLENLKSRGFVGIPIDSPKLETERIYWESFWPELPMMALFTLPCVVLALIVYKRRISNQSAHTTPASRSATDFRVWLSRWLKKEIDKIHLIHTFRCMGRTNINLDDKLVSKGLKITGLRTKRELVDLALRELLRKEDQKSILALEGKFKWEGDLDELRKGRFAR